MNSLKNLVFAENKKGQITIFIILAILIVAAIIMVFFLYENNGLTIKPGSSDVPQDFLSSCLNENLEKGVDLVFENSGYIVLPENTKNYNGRNIPYLCYTSEYRLKCIVAEPVLVEHLSDELHSYMKSEVAGCLNLFKEESTSKGYQVNVVNNGFSVSLVPDKVKVNIDGKITLNKAEEQRSFDNFESYVNSPLYEIAVIVHKIIEQEAKYCNSDYVALMRANHWVDITKDQTGDDEKIYTVKDTKSGKSLQFAMRNCVLPTPS